MGFRGIDNNRVMSIGNFISAILLFATITIGTFLCLSSVAYLANKEVDRIENATVLKAHWLESTMTGDNDYWLILQDGPTELSIFHVVSSQRDIFVGDKITLVKYFGRSHFRKLR